ncbi:MAG TPA: hypothetical protein VF469_21970, partial [Kofleriaceae bacterium]
MTERDDEDASGVPERAERTDSGRYVTDSGRHITNRNVVPRNPAPGPAPDDDSATREPDEHGEHGDAGWPRLPDDFDVDTPVRPVRPEPRDVFDEAAVELSHADAPGPDGAPGP